MSPVRSAVLTLALAGLAGCTPRSPAEDTPPAEGAPPAAPAPAEEAPPADAPPADPKAAFEARARAATGTLKKTLMGALQTALQTGPAEAVTACNTQAPEITRAAAAAGVTVGRTAAKLRNPGNAPTPWLAPLLEKYAGTKAGEAGPEVVEIEGGGFGYVEPLYVGGLCTTCHGQPEAMPEAVKSRLAALYPLDAATGYAVGDFRGLVWATGE